MILLCVRQGGRKNRPLKTSMEEGLARMAEVPRRLGDADRVVANKR